MLPNAGEALGLVGAKPFDVQAPGGTQGQKAPNSLSPQAGQRKLERAGHKLLLGQPLWQLQARRAGQSLAEPVVALVPAPAPVGQHRAELRQRQRGGQVAHAQAEIGRAVLPAFKHGLVGPGAVRGVKHVTARVQNGPRGQVRIARDQQAAFAAVGVLVALQAEASRQTPGAGSPTIPARAHGVGAVLDQCDALLGTDLAQALHVADMAAHVRQQQGFGAAAARLARQVVQVNGVVVTHVHQHRPCPGMGQRTRHRRQRETVGQHRVTRHHPSTFERHKHAGATGVERHAIRQPQLSRKGCFER